jgi:hypothetical protein
MTKSKGNTLDKWRSVHDKSVVIPRLIQAAIDKLAAPDADDTWLYDQDFLKLAGVCVTDAARYRAPFEANIVMTAGKNPKRAWFGSTKDAAEARRMV